MFDNDRNRQSFEKWVLLENFFYSKLRFHFTFEIKGNLFKAVNTAAFKMSWYSTKPSAENPTNFVDTLWIPLISWTRCSTSSAVNVYNFRGNKKKSRTWTTNKPIPRPRQLSFAVNKYQNSGQSATVEYQILIFLYYDALLYMFIQQ